MKPLKVIFSLFILLLGFSGCYFDVNDDEGFFGCIEGDGPNVSQEFVLPDFNGISPEFTGKGLPHTRPITRKLPLKALPILLTI